MTSILPARGRVREELEQRSRVVDELRDAAGVALPPRSVTHKEPTER